MTRKQIYALDVPVSRKSWIAAEMNAAGAQSDMPLQRVVQFVNGAVNDRSVVQ